jgi:hypothetical protein|tara:strand:- start:1 stop:132 length:132 start_codon:yes stop_codon:yes gene_type:complete
MKIKNKFFPNRLVFVYSNKRNLNITYLRGLIIAKLKEEDIPMV